ncbi:MAG: hypothetical protein ACPGVB_08610 [Chitinophagales bacterium]
MANNKKRKPSWILQGIDILIFVFASSLLINMISDEAEEMFRDKLGDYFGHFIAVVFIGIFLLRFYISSILSKQETLNTTKEDRNDLIEGLEKRYN